MAKKVITVITDDLTGEESSEAATHIIALDGVTYEIDLGPDSYDQLLDAIGPFLKAGRRTRAAGKARVTKPAAGQEDTAKIRAWAKENGHDVNDRGRVSASIREAYAKATS
ncbi:Lsr2 family protein [Streptomyces sp. NPDC014733]|uniref:histone-like nucleoid-structuring protein Lsr2 n=1 Tax=Streptomyces sp. NPDC014733 TaxID=3364885 RepID=UPI0036F79AEB